MIIAPLYLEWNSYNTSEIYLKGYLLCYAESMNLPTEKVLDDYIRVYKNSARSENG